MKLYLAGILGLCATACIPGIPILTPKAPPKQASEIMNAAAIEPHNGAGVIIVNRDKALRRMGCTYDIALDGQVVAGLRNGEHVTIYADPGQRIVAVSIRPENSCDPALAEVPVQVVANATTTMRVVSDIAYDLRIELTTY
jgi:hypothetical protein